MSKSSQIPNFPPEKLRITPLLRILSPIIRFTVKKYIQLRYKALWQFENRNNIPDVEGLLIFSNHISNSDPFLVQLSCPRHINFMARRELFAMKGIAPFVKFWKAFPVTQSSSDSTALKTAIALVKRGQAVCVFPEGQLSPTGELIQLLPGASLLVKKSGVKCICVGIQNSNKLMPYPMVEPQIANATLIAKWGEPKSFDPKTNSAEVMSWIESELKYLTDQLRKDSPKSSNSEE